jgi:hypothetical protein
MANREELHRALTEGAAVEVNGRRVLHPRDLPKEAEDGPAVEGVVVFDAAGRMTREGMEHTIRSGGSVLLRDARGDSRVIARLDDLPGEEELAAGDEKRLAAHAASLDAQMAALAAERARVTAAAEKAREAKAAAPPDEPKRSRRQRKKADAPDADVPDAGDEDGGEGEGAEGGTPRE